MTHLVTIELLQQIPKKQQGDAQRDMGTRLSISVLRICSSSPSIISARSRKCINMNGIYLKTSRLVSLNTFIESVSKLMYDCLTMLHRFPARGTRNDVKESQDIIIGMETNNHRKSVSKKKKMMSQEFYQSS